MLEEANLGRLVKVLCGNRANEIFIKKLPSEIGPALEGNEDLCSFENYSLKFYMPSPSSIRQRLREELILRNIVREEDFTNVIPRNPLSFHLDRSSDL